MNRLHWIALLATAVVAGCTTTSGPYGEAAISEEAPSLQAVRDRPDSYQGQQVRWGGTIAGIANRAHETCIEVVGKELGGDGRPKLTDSSEGRFIGCIDRFLDPAIYTGDREVTVIGTVSGATSGKIGEFHYSYPRVRIDRVRLWEPLPDYLYYPDPWGYYGYGPGFWPGRYPYWW